MLLLVRDFGLCGDWGCFALDFDGVEGGTEDLSTSVLDVLARFGLDDGGGVGDSL